MNIDLGSFAFGTYLNSGTGTPSWGTALGQSQPEYKFTYPGAEVILIGMMYCSVPLNRVSLPLGKGGRIYKASEIDECQIASLFRKVYINGTRIDYPFTLVLVKESSDSHPGRKSIKYTDKITYSDNREHYSNIDFIRCAQKTLGLKEEACWFVYSLEVYNQDELHMSAVIVDKVKNSAPGFGFDAQNEEYVDMKKVGIVDPTKVTRSALQNAASIASMCLTTESIITDKKEKLPPPPMGAPEMPMGMDGMY